MILATVDERNLGVEYSTCCESLLLGVDGNVYCNVDDLAKFRAATDEERSRFIYDLKVGARPGTARTPEAEPAWKPTPEQMEALMLTIEGDAPTPTSYLSRRLEDLYEGLANTYGVECDLHNEDNATKETFDNPISALADLCDKVEKYTRQGVSRSILMDSLHAAQQLLAGK